MRNIRLIYALLFFMAIAPECLAAQIPREAKGSEPILCCGQQEKP